MNAFGNELKKFHHRAIDPNTNKSITLERLAILLSEKSGIHYSLVTVNNWERGKSKIRADDRKTLVGLIQILHKFGGIESFEEAETLLEKGEYRGLTPEEIRDVFGEVISAQSSSSSAFRGDLQPEFPNEILDISKLIREIRSLFAIRADSPAKTTLILDGLGKLTGRLRWEHALWAIFWFVVVWLTYLPAFPMLQWPFPNAEEASLRVLLFVGSSIIIPLLVGAGTRTKNNLYWKPKIPRNSLSLRLFTYQGAFIGFDIGYIVVFIVKLLAYYAGREQQSTLWLDLLASSAIVYLAHLAAVQVPYNLWRAYRELDVKAWAVFFVFVPFGTLFGAFFLNAYPVLLSPILGLPIILVSVFLLGLMSLRQEHRIGSTLITADIWAFFFGALFVLYQISESGNLFVIVSSACLVAASVVTLALERNSITFSKIAFGVFGPAVLLSTFLFSDWFGWVSLTLLFAFAWFRRNTILCALWLYWGTVAGIVTGAIMIRDQVLNIEQAAGLVALATFLLIALKWLTSPGRGKRKQTHTPKKKLLG